MHHLSVDWPDALISEYDPLKNGALPDNFAGAGNDMVLLGDRLEPMRPLATLRQYAALPAFPSLLFFAGNLEALDQDKIRSLGVAAVFNRNSVDHDEFVEVIRGALSERRELASTERLFFTEEAGSLAVRGFRLVRKLAASTFSSVYLTEHMKTNQLHVLKVVNHVPDAVEEYDNVFSRFLQEYEVISSLNHPNIVKISDFGVGDDHAFIAMEYFRDGDLKQRLRKGMSVDESTAALTEIAGALAAIHAVGILHRDLKPGNIMVRSDGSLALIDFGLAKQIALEGEITGTGEIFGTPYYMSPEQGHGHEVDERSDIYSLGVIFYEMLTGNKPFTADSPMGIIYKQSHAERPVLTGSAAPLQPLLEKMIAIDPDDRFRSADEIVAAVRSR